MNSPTLSIIFVFLCFGLVYIEPLPINFNIYDYFNLSEDNCSSIIGTELNFTLYDACSRPLPNLDDVITDPHRISVLNDILKCVGALNTVKQYYCRNNKNDSVLNQSTSNFNQLKISDFCDKIDNPFNLQKKTFNVEKNPPTTPKLILNWLIELNNKISSRQNCTQLCSDSTNPGGVDYLCVVMINAKQSEKSVVSVKPTTASLQTIPTNKVVSKVPAVTGGENNEASGAQLEKDKESTVEKTQNQQKNNANFQPTDLQHSNLEVSPIDQGQKQEAHHEETGVVSTKSQETTNGDSLDSINTGKNIEIENSNNLGVEMSDDKDQISNNESGEMLYNDSDLSQVDNRMGMEEDNGKPTNALMTRSKPGYIKDYNVEEKSNLFFYIMWMFIMIIFGSMVFHNKNKLIALIVEGRRSRSRSRSGGRHSSTNYSKLHSNLEETMTSSTAPSSTHVLY